MQKDVHFYVTYALARKAGLPAEDAEKVAWADQYTDDLTESDLHGIQTQSAVAGNWADRQVQLSVLVPFHFVPGTDAEHPWMTTAGSERALKLVRLARGNTLHLGIALHAFQDTFSHERFSGWREDLNACFPWYFVEAALPNVGHAELRVVPDNTSNVNLFQELGTPTYFVYSAGAYQNQSGGQSKLYPTAGGGWLSERPCGSYFAYASSKRLVSAYDLYDNTLYFYYDGSGHHQYLLSHETGRAVYFQTDAGGRVTSVKDWGGRETTLSYDGSARLNKVVGPSLCVTYFSYDAGGNLNRLTDPEGRTLYYQYDGTDRVTSEKYGSAATYFTYDL